MPEIEFLDGDTWCSLLGHGCTTLKEAEDYCRILDPNGKCLRIKKAENEE